MAAEESGGFGFGFHLPERDALLALIIVLSTMAERKAQLRELRKHIAERFGHPYFHREDIQLVDTAQAEAVRQRVSMLRDEPKLAGIKADHFSELDGLKIVSREGFLLLRFSGTEPLLRIYCEHQAENQEKELVQRVKEFLFES